MGHRGGGGGGGGVDDDAQFILFYTYNIRNTEFSLPS